jgi:hypothetical protein
MKKIIKLVVVLLFVAGPLVLFAQNPPHPNGGNDPTSGGNTPVGGAPIDGGLSILMVLGSAYAFKKAYKLKK